MGSRIKRICGQLADFKRIGRMGVFTVISGFRRLAGGSELSGFEMNHKRLGGEFSEFGLSHKLI